MCANGSSPPRATCSFCQGAETRASGQPAIDHIKTALDLGAHAISVNKGPIVHAFSELTSLAREKGKKFLYEATVMDGVPIFSLFPLGLPATDLHGFFAGRKYPTQVVHTHMQND